MKRVLVLSDSHGNVGNMIRAVKREEPDMILHLGDCVVDADALIEGMLEAFDAAGPRSATEGYVVTMPEQGRE